MEDSKIIDLYWARNEEAVTETTVKYGDFCHSIALNLLHIQEDAQECVNDTWLAAWNAMPPQRPPVLQAWLGRVTRNLAFKRWRRDHAQKRYAGITEIYEELSECIPASGDVENEIEERQLSQAIDGWLSGLKEEDRYLFVLRYWYGIPLMELAERLDIPQGRLAQRMFRLRGSLKKALETSGIDL